MGISDEVYIECIKCGLTGSLREFGSWEKDGKRGYLGKTSEGFMMLVCPKCGEEIKYDPMNDIGLVVGENGADDLYKVNNLEKVNLGKVIVVAIILALIIIGIRLIIK